MPEISFGKDRSSMEGVLSDAISLANGECQVDGRSGENTGCSADECPNVPVQHEDPHMGRSSGKEASTELSNVCSVGEEGGHDDKNPIRIPELAAKRLETLSRKEKRKNLKKLRRKQIRQEAAEKEKLDQLVRSEDPEEQLRIQEAEKLEAEQAERERLEHEEQERLFLERERKAQEEFERKREELLKKEEERKEQQNDEENWRYVEDDGPAEIIWQGNEIIVRKKRVKVPAEKDDEQLTKNTDQPTSNPLPPQSTAFAAHKFQPPSTPDQGEQNPVFGTEQDKTHCPFHIKTGVCRFGTRCSRVHVYPDHSFTLLMRNMYTGPGLNWDHDEGLENLCYKLFQRRWKLYWRPVDENGISAHHSDEEVAEQYEEFYEDVHSEFLQFGELVNFKVCNNGSSHLRGNVYVHYQTEAGAQAAYNAMNGRFYAGKQITCEFVGVTRWRVALCGEYMKGHHRPCSHGSACNFLHCFRNPRGEYDWADWDSPAPRYWAVKMAKLFGHEHDRREGEDSYHDESHRRRRSSERVESSGRRHRSKSRYSRVDDSEDLRRRARRRHRSRERRHRIPDESHQSSPDELESSSRHGRRRRHQRSAYESVGEESRTQSFGNVYVQDMWSNGRKSRKDSSGNENEKDVTVSQACETEDVLGKKYPKREHAGRERSMSKRNRTSSRKGLEGDSSDAETDKTPKSPRGSESKRDARRSRGEKRRHGPVYSELVEDDRWRPES